MKKIVSVLMIAFIATLLSSCVVVAVDSPRYTMYFYNDTASQYIYDWYVEDADGNNYLPDTEPIDGYYEVDCGEYDWVSNLPRGNYRIVFCIYAGRTADYYLTSDYEYIDEDMSFRLRNEVFYEGKWRSAGNSGTEEEETQLVLVDSKGNKYPLEKVEK